MRNTKKKKLYRTLNTKDALARLFGNRKHRPCAYCGKALTLDAASFDHVRPLSEGGYDKTKNGAISCRVCNNRKGAMSREDFLKVLASASSVQAIRRRLKPST